MSNRILKFRAWDKLAKRFITPETQNQNHYVLSLDGKFQNLQDGSGGEEYVVQQFTGLFDKDGKEIYEGDILLDGDKNLKEVQWEYTTYVLFYIKGFWFDKLSGREMHSKIIGNIFENPELLNNV